MTTTDGSLCIIWICSLAHANRFNELGYKAVLARNIAHEFVMMRNMMSTRIWLGASCLLFFGLAIAQEHKYTTKYDNVDIESVIGNERLLNGYVGCLLDRKPCTPDAAELKSTFIYIINRWVCNYLYVDLKLHESMLVGEDIPRKDHYTSNDLERERKKRVYSKYYSDSIKEASARAIGPRKKPSCNCFLIALARGEHPETDR